MSRVLLRSLLILFILLLLSTAWILRGLIGAVVFEQDIRYGQVRGEAGDIPLFLNLAKPRFANTPSDTGYPAVLILHGGGWREGDKSDMNFLAKLVASRGYITMTVQYRLSPTHTFPAALHDVKCAIRWLRANAAELQVDPQRIAIMGGSAGAHLAMMAGVTQPSDGLEGQDCHDGYSSEVVAVVNMVGPADLTKQSIDSFVYDFVGGDSRELMERASPITYIDSDDPPMLTIHGDSDTVVDYEHALILQHALEKAGVEHILFTAEGAGHGWMGLRNGIGAQLAMNSFLDRHLKY